ncbi:steroid 17-alpha-hydroxylase/17,20 lyase-like isoform X3 [Stylophora pistillata]|uniref:steroid 17-alpha-hydroxylase/17,20 lyase-like isoform X3 n=1 Tax=Stylophora pistillata TaxID=50429 RepID=UPI000C04CCC2|nr:steroid 17-alpha-hydroxylase/17,20 lyase-like isoform X3 [Stylophora pistillata]
MNSEKCLQVLAIRLSQCSETCCRLTPQPRLCLTSLKGRPQTYAFYTQTLGGKDIIMGNFGPQWKKQRKLFTAALRQYLLDVPLIERRVATQAKKLIQFMEEQNEKPFNPSDCLMRSVANVICGITFGEGEDTTNPELDQLLKLNADVIANDDDLRLATVLEFFSWARYLPLKVYDRVLQPFFEIHDILRKIFRLRAKKYDPAEPVENLISGLLRAKYEAENKPDDEMGDVQLSEDHFVITIEDMFVGGYETTSTTLKWVIAFLVRYPQHQKDIQRQLDEVIGAERNPSLNDRSSLPLVLATIMETLRVGNLLPIALPHVALTDTTLCGYRVPRDTIVFANTEAIHLDPKFWEDPTLFNPYRHLDKDGNLITNQGNFYPFGAGRRACPGEALAKVELFIFISWMLQKFTFVADEGHPVNTKGAFVQFPSPYKIRAVKRQ